MILYEGMFLLDPALASDMEAAEAELTRILTRAGAELVGKRSWDERKLAYPIKKFRRGLYILTYFKADPEKITGLERDVQLSDTVLRVLVLNRETMTDEAVQKSLAADPPKMAPRREERDERGDRGDRGDRGGRGGRGERGDRRDRAEGSDDGDRQSGDASNDESKRDGDAPVTASAGADSDD